MNATTRRKWDDTSIERECRAVAESLGHFPSNAELVRMGRGDLSNAVAKSHGFLAWSERLGIARVHSDSDTGWDGERAFMQLAEDHGLVCERPKGVKSPFDLPLCDVLRVDVKSAKKATYAGKSSACTGWFYRLGKRPQADLMVFFQLDTGDFYAMPWTAVPHTNVTIATDGGKYAAYRNNWDVIESMIRRRREEVTAIGLGRMAS